jgi:3-deoxy-D-manno-octulosonate 8-phosphate phosphatase (KDO 8-P phosphatase)
MQEIVAKAAQIELVIFDVDGVLTDGRLYFGNDGNEFKAFHSRDGHGIKMLLDAGLEVAIISGRRAVSVEQRIRDLGIRYAYLGIADKRTAFEQLRTQLGLAAHQIAYVGDDLIDLPVMTQVGLAIAVQDADAFVKQHAHWQTPSCGGCGAAREVCELVLEARGQLQAQRSRYL